MIYWFFFLYLFIVIVLGYLVPVDLLFCSFDWLLSDIYIWVLFCSSMYLYLTFLYIWNIDFLVLTGGNWYGVFQLTGMFFDSWMGASFYGFEKKIWTSLLYVVVWSVWWIRNRMLFKNFRLDWEWGAATQGEVRLLDERVVLGFAFLAWICCSKFTEG